MAPTLFYSPGACSLAPHVVLQWIGEPYEAVRVKIGSPELLKINPSGAVPALDTGEGWTLTQNAAILQYIARRYPAAKLGATDDLHDQAEMERWLAYFTGDLHPAFFPVFMTPRYTTSRDAKALEDVKDAGLDLVRKRLDVLNAHLAGKNYIVGNRRTIADAYALPMLRWAVAKLPEGLAKHPNVQALLDRLTSDPVVQAVIKSEETSG